MGRYSLHFKQSVAKDLRAIPKKDVQRILQRIQSLADDPRPPGSEKLVAQERYRVRQGLGHRETKGFSQRTGRCGPVRLLLEIQDDVLVVVVVKVSHRSEVYR